MSSDNDFMELGDTNLVPMPDGWFLNKETGETIDPNGYVYDKSGEVIFDPFEEVDGSNHYDDDYEWYDDKN
jgi:hypothetical protein